MTFSLTLTIVKLPKSTFRVNYEKDGDKFPAFIDPVSFEGHLESAKALLNEQAWCLAYQSGT